jgi:hypothetical protein
MRTDPDEQRIKEAWKEFNRGAREIGAMGPLSWDLICKAVRAQELTTVIRQSDTTALIKTAPQNLPKFKDVIQYLEE